MAIEAAKSGSFFIDTPPVSTRVGLREAAVVRKDTGLDFHSALDLAAELADKIEGDNFPNHAVVAGSLIIDGINWERDVTQQFVGPIDSPAGQTRRPDKHESLNHRRDLRLNSDRRILRGLPVHKEEPLVSTDRFDRVDVDKEPRIIPTFEQLYEGQPLPVSLSVQELLEAQTDPDEELVIDEQYVPLADPNEHPLTGAVALDDLKDIANSRFELREWKSLVDGIDRELHPNQVDFLTTNPLEPTVANTSQPLV